MKQVINQMLEDGSLPCRTQQDSCASTLMMKGSRLPDSCVSLLGKYGSVMDFLKACNPSVQLQICKDVPSCYFGDSPTLSVIDRTYGKRKANAWLIPQLLDLSLCCGLKEDASREQLEFTATFIATDFHWLKTSELMLFFYRFKAGCYERFFSRFDPQVILSSLRMFLQERARAYEARDEELRRQKEAEHKARCISYEEYCRKNGLDPVLHKLGKMDEIEGSPLLPTTST